MQWACAVLYYHLWPVRLYHNFLHYLINGTIFGKTVIEHKICVLIFATNFSEIYLSLRIIQQNIFINVNTYSCKVSVILFVF
jgi:hypothetical protein